MNLHNQLYKSDLDQNDRIEKFMTLISEHDTFIQFDPQGLNRNETVIGVASGWSYSEVQLLDEIGANLKNRKVSVFDITIFKNQADIKNCFFSEKNIIQTPIYAEFVCGRTAIISQGREAVDHIKNLMDPN
ncbi:MAG: hypothetical protein ACSHYA_14475 [Opitutaceae bacterium]